MARSDFGRSGGSLGLSSKTLSDECSAEEIFGTRDGSTAGSESRPPPSMSSFGDVPRRPPHRGRKEKPPR